MGFRLRSPLFCTNRGTSTVKYAVAKGGDQNDQAYLLAHETTPTSPTYRWRCEIGIRRNPIALAITASEGEGTTVFPKPSGICRGADRVSPIVTERVMVAAGCMTDAPRRAWPLP